MAPPPASLTLSKRTLTPILLAFAIITIFYLTFRPPPAPISPLTFTTTTSSLSKSSLSSPPLHDAPVDPAILKGGVISSKIENATAKAELGRAAWKVLHTTMAKFPDKPTKEEQTALTSYIWLFARLYPCGECAGHFQEILNRFPPQVATRSNAAAWACHVHNEVNRSLEKVEFDCSKIGDFYDCGCGDDDEAGGGKEKEGNAAKGVGRGKEVGEEDEIDISIERNG